jgi:N-acetylneuraminic acid mutarotase
MATMAVLSVAVALAAAGGAQAAFSGVPALGTGRYNHTSTLLKDGRLLVAGGTNSGPLDSARLYDPAQNTWADAAPMKIAREGDTAVLLHSGKVLVAGGQTSAPGDGSPAYTRTAEVYDPATDTWTQTAGSMSTGRFQPTMTVLGDGRVLVAGGTGSVDTGQGVRSAVSLDSAEIYNPDTDTFSDAASMSVPRAMHTASLLPDGKVLVAGGYDATSELSSAELYDPAADTWTATGPLGTARDSATATVLPNDDVLVAGGDGGTGAALASAELYRPDTGTWHSAASMTGARQSAAAALLKDGTVLVTGGEDARLGKALGTAERYDPAADAWSDAGALKDARKGHTVTALDDGRALVVGGNAGGFGAGLAGVERWSPVSTTVTVANFGSRDVGSPSDVVDAVVKNTGTAPLVVTGASLAGHADFAIDSESCSAAPVQPGATCQVGVVFTPQAAGPRDATLTLADNTAAGSTTAALAGTGNGSSPAGGTNPGAGAPAGASGPTGAAADAHAGVTPRLEVKGAKSGSARAACSVGSSRRRGAPSTVTCRLTWPTHAAVGLSVKLMRGRTTVAQTRTTARGGHAQVSLRLARRLRSGRYTVVIARPNGTVVLRQALRVS